MIKLYHLLLLLLITCLVNGGKYIETKRCLIQCNQSDNITNYCSGLNDLGFKLCLMSKRDLPKNCKKICLKN